MSDLLGTALALGLLVVAVTIATIQILTKLFGFSIETAIVIHLSVLCVGIVSNAVSEAVNGKGLLSPIVLFALKILVYPTLILAGLDALRDRLGEAATNSNAMTFYREIISSIATSVSTAVADISPRFGEIVMATAAQPWVIFAIVSGIAGAVMLLGRHEATS